MPNTVFRCLWFFISQQKYTFLLMMIVCISVSFCQNNLWPYVSGEIVDKLSVTVGGGEINADIVLMAFLAWLAVELVQRVKGFLYAALYSKFEGNVRSAVFRWVMGYPYSYFSGKRFGVIAYRIDDFPRSLRVIIDVVMVNFIPLVFSAMMTMFLVHNVHPDLAFSFIIWLSVYSSMLFFFVCKASNKAMDQSMARSRLQGALSDSISNYFAVQTCNGLEAEAKIVNRLQSQEVNLYRRTINNIEKSKLFLAVINVYFVYIIFNKSLDLLALGEITIGNIAFMFNSTISIMSGIWYASDEINYILTEIGALKQSIGILHYDAHHATQEKILDSEKSVLNKNRSYKGTVYNSIEKKIEENKKVVAKNYNTVEELHPDGDFEDDAIIKRLIPESSKKPLIITQGEIEFKNIHFGHEEPGGVFRNLNVTIKGKQKVGLVGFSGSGKSSFANLIVRLYDIDQGRILIDGQDIMLHSLDSLRSQIIIMQQEPILFNRSVRDNIRYGCLDVNDDDVVEAAIKSHSHAFIMKLPDQYDTIVGGSSSRLSGGQKQRIIIARAMLRESPIIIMDEATSALDTATEMKIQESLDSLTKNKTVIIIAHRLSTVLNMDRILVFKNGNIIEDGAHSELASNENGYYNSLWKMQRDGLLPEKQQQLDELDSGEKSVKI